MRCPRVQVFMLRVRAPVLTVPRPFQLIPDIHKDCSWKASGFAAMRCCIHLEALDVTAASAQTGGRRGRTLTFLVIGDRAALLRSHVDSDSAAPKRSIGTTARFGRLSAVG
jgi:hypothetical protein